jgi:hypothetical protein
MLLEGIINQPFAVPFVPTDIANLGVWYGDYVNNGTLRTTLSNNDAITRWDDSSGNNRYATPMSGKNNAFYVSAENALSFSPTGNDTVFQSQFFTYGLGNYTRFVVCKTTYNKFYLIGYDSAVSIYSYMYNSGASWECNASGGKSSMSTTSGWASNGVYNLLRQQIDGTHANHKCYKNNTQQSVVSTHSSQNPGTNNTSNDVRLGAGGAAGNEIRYKEVLQYNRLLNETEIAQVENYLNTKYSIY